jgi:DNA primase
MSVGPIGSYSHRILAPIYFNGQVVSYQCRATKRDQKPPYLACAKRDELIEHKCIVYGFDEAVRLNRCIVVEGITDAWRLGHGAVATFGKSFTPSQVLLIAKNFDQIFVLPDSDVKDGETITDALRMLGSEVEEYELEKGDPGDLSQDQADALMRELGF